MLKDVPIGELPTEMTSEWQLCHLTGQGPTEAIRFTHREQTAEITFLADGLKRFRSGLESAGLSASFFRWPPKGDESRSPYRGLEPLDAQDAAVFFGRDAEILQGLDKLRGMRAAGDEGLFVILGASGAGKSSFLRAGLLPRLARDDRHFLPLTPVRPERSPLIRRARAGTGHLQGPQHSTTRPRQPRRSTRGAQSRAPSASRRCCDNIQNAAQARLARYRMTPAPNPGAAGRSGRRTLQCGCKRRDPRVSRLDRHRVARLAQRQPDRTARAVDRRLHHPLGPLRTLQTAPELAGLKTVVFDALRPMHPAQFKEIIVGPAAPRLVNGRPVEFKPDLVDQLLTDCAQGADTLPLLSLTLARLYTDYGNDGDLRLDEYLGMGGMVDVIRGEVESILAVDADIRKPSSNRCMPRSSRG